MTRITFLAVKNISKLSHPISGSLKSQFRVNMSDDIAVLT